MAIVFPTDSPETILRKLARLHSDIIRIAGRGAPHPGALAAVPVLENWHLGIGSNVCVIGDVFAHPQISQGCPINTSEVYAVDETSGWARTRSGFIVSVNAAL